jgi:hypothetical protein
MKKELIVDVLKLNLSDKANGGKALTLMTWMWKV